MSSLENALRQVNDRRRQADNDLAVPLMTAPASHGKSSQWPLIGLALLLAVAGLGAGALWMRRDAPPAMPPSNPGAVPMAATPMPLASDQPETKPSSFEKMDWQERPRQVWRAGYPEQAAGLWLSELGRQPASTTAMLVADRQTLDQVLRLHAQWSDRLPVVVLMDRSGSVPTWTMLAVPVAQQVNAARDLLRSALGRTPARNNLSHWLARLEPRMPAAVQDSSLPTPRPAQPTSPGAVASSAERQGPPAALADPPVASNPAAKAVDALPARQAAVPEVAASAASAHTPTTAGAASSSVSRSIDAEFQAIEKLLVRGEFSGARQAAERLEQFAGKTWRTRYLAGVASSGLGRWEEAVAALTEAHDKNPGHIQVALYLSVALQERGEHVQALSALGTVLERHPNTPELWLNRGISLQAMGRGTEATQSYQRFLELSLQRPDLQAQRAWAQTRLQREK